MNRCIAVNIGNSRISSGIFVDGKLVDLSHYLVGNTTAAATDIAKRAVAMRIDNVAVCSVVPPAMHTLVENLRAADLDVFEVTGQKQNIISGTYETLGADRIANLVAALNLYVRTHVAIVIDLGTATTLTAVDSRGRFLGGLITLGLSETLKALYNATEQLPSLDLFSESQENIPLAQDTDTAIVSGTVLGHVGLIEHWIKTAKHELNSKATVIATGGLSRHLAPYTKAFDHVDPNLTIQGIRLIREAAGDRAGRA